MGSTFAHRRQKVRSSRSAVVAVALNRYRINDNLQMGKLYLFNRSTGLRNVHGFTLIELLVVVAIVGILASVAYPSFMSQVQKSRRSDAVAAVSKVQQAQERWRANNTTYASDTEMTAPITPVPPATLSGLGISSTSEGKYYTLAVSGNTATGYTLTATAVSGKSQTSDTGCSTLTVSVANGATDYQPAACWSK